MVFAHYFFKKENYSRIFRLIPLDAWPGLPRSGSALILERQSSHGTLFAVSTVNLHIRILCVFFLYFG
jgi:hypothetical protein